MSPSARIYLTLKIGESEHKIHSLRYDDYSDTPNVQVLFLHKLENRYDKVSWNIPDFVSAAREDGILDYSDSPFISLLELLPDFVHEEVSILTTID